MSERTLQLVVPGSLSQVTGGYHYDRRLIEGLRELGWRITVRSLQACFPFPTSEGLAEASAVLSSISSGTLVLIDGLALGAMPQVLAPHAARLRLVGLIHHPLALESGLAPAAADQLRRSEQAALQSVRHVIVTSLFTRETLASYGLAAAQVSVVEPGTDEAPLAMGSGAGSLEILCVANILPRKGHDLLIEALGTLARLPWRLSCVGSTKRSPATVEALYRQVQEAGLGMRVRILGELDGSALEWCFLATDLFVLPSRHEGFGMAVAEALAHGVPVVATRTGAIPDLVLPGAGVVVPPGDSSALRAALSDLLTRPEVLAGFAEGARAVRDRLPRWPQSCARAARILAEVSCR